MTEIDIHVILKSVTSAENTGREPVFTTVAVERNVKMTEKNKIMEMTEPHTEDSTKIFLLARNINLREATNYLVQLFYKTNQEYSCTRTKLGKLLSIAAFVFARRGERLFNETINKYKNCGVAINELKLYVDREVYQRSSYKDNRKEITQDFDTLVMIPNIYKMVDTLPDDVCEVITSVFRNFGAYAADDLGHCLNPIVNTPAAIDADGRVRLEWFTIENITSVSTCSECAKLIDYIK